LSAPVLHDVRGELLDRAVLEQARRFQLDLQRFADRANEIHADDGIDAEVANEASTRIVAASILSASDSFAVTTSRA